MEAGRQIAGRYRLLERLGQGGMSVVWRADDEVLGREVAVKVLSAAYAKDPAVAGQIRAEARTAAGLRHANVVSVYDYGEVNDDGQTLSFIVMELVEGRSLADMLTGGPLPWKLSVLVGAQVAAALAAAHAHGIVHRDVKPANVMVTGSGMKLVDFGISAAVGGLDDRDGQLLGTPAYLAPERIEGGPVRPATDVYALGLLLYRCLSGRMPWPAATVTQMVKAHVQQKPAPLPAVTGLPASVARLVTRCLAKKPAERPSAGEVADVLGEIAGLTSTSLLRSTVMSTIAVPAPGARPRARVLVTAGAVAAVMGVAGTWWLYDASSGRPPAAVAAAPSGAVTSGAPVSSGTPTTVVVVARVASSRTATAPGTRPRAASTPQPPSGPEAAPAPPAKAEPAAVKKPPKPKKPKKK